MGQLVAETGKAVSVRMYPDDDAPPRPGELEALTEDVVYEYEGFLWAASQLLGALDDGRARNALVEVLLLHQRNLVAFFGGGRWKDDVIAQDYAPSWSPKGQSWKWLEGRQRSVNKRLAHITAYRRRVPKQVDAKEVREVRRHVMQVWAQFASHAAPRWGDQFRVDG